MNKFGLIGYPLSHSFSPDYFKSKFEQHQILDCTYESYPLDNLTGFRAWFFENNLLGVNVTIPFKERILEHLDRLDQVAESVGAVNCVALQNDELVGFNTDVEGFARSIVPFVENKFERALLIGTGGASKAVAFALKRWGMDVYFLSRQPSLPNHLAYTDLTKDNIAYFPLIINCSPLGTYPDIMQCPEIPYEALSSHHFLYDLIYNPELTMFMKRGQEHGALVMNGLKMLQLQADLSWDIWNRYL
jgi:shikimate dehydrogenase